MKPILTIVFSLVMGCIYSQSLSLIHGTSPLNISKKELTKQIANSRGVVIIFYSSTCPICQKMTAAINELSAKYSEKNILFLLVYPGRNEKAKRVRKYHQDYKLNIHALGDYDKQLVGQFEATITPEVVLVDKQLETLYSGKINNWFESLGQRRTVITEHYLENAINSFLEGKEIEIKKTEPVDALSIEL